MSIPVQSMDANFQPTQTYWHRKQIFEQTGDILAVDEVRDPHYPNRYYRNVEDAVVPLSVYRSAFIISGTYRDTNYPHMKTPMVQMPMARRHVQLITSFDCDLRCDYCYMKPQLDTWDAEKELPTEVWLDWLERWNYRYIDISITGGEPLKPSQYAKTRAIVEKALQGNTRRITIMTNGQHPLPDDWDFESDKCMINFIVGLDGLREEHDSHRGIGTWDKAVAFLKQTRERGYWVSTQWILQGKPNYEQMEEYLALVRGEGLCAGGTPAFMLCRPMGGAVGNTAIFDIKANEHKALCKWFEKNHVFYQGVMKCSDGMLRYGSGPLYISPYGHYAPCDKLFHTTNFGEMYDDFLDPARAKSRMADFDGVDCYGFTRHTGEDNVLNQIDFDAMAAISVDEQFMRRENNYSLEQYENYLYPRAIEFTLKSEPNKPRTI